MEINDFILGILERLKQTVTKAVDSLTHEELVWRPDVEANSIGFILWHLLRAEDSFVQGMIQQKPQVWVSEKWYQKLDLPESPANSGYGYTAEQVANFAVPELKDLLGYLEAVRAQTVAYLKATPPEKFAQVIPTRPFGELTIGQIFSILLCEITQHIGQIAYVRGLQRGLNK